MKRVLLFAAICLIAVPALASPDIMPTANIKSIASVGIDPVSGQTYDVGSYDRYGTEIYWTVTDYLYFSWVPGDPYLVLEWGDLAAPGVGFEIGAFHCTYLATAGPGPGTDIVLTWIADENGFNSTTRVPWARLTLLNFPGTPYAQPPNWGSGWDFFIDIQSIPWIWTLDGNDIDGDGLIDMGYSIWFKDVPAPCQGMGTLFGPYAPIGTEDGGAEDAFDIFGDPNYATYYGTYWFGGPPNPFAQFQMQWHGLGCPNDGIDPPGIFDYCYTDIYPVIGDCIVNLSDLGVLLPNYAGTATPYTFNQGDVYPVVFGDGLVNLSDLGQLLAQYGDNCNDGS